MSDDSLDNRIFLITANVGSIFEDECRLQGGWLREILETIKRWSPAFIALHMQEIGGKDYRNCMQYVPKFINTLQNSLAELGYAVGRAYVDMDFNAESQFTALGSVYVCHLSAVARVEQYDFRQNAYKHLTDFNIVSDDIESDDTIERQRFPKSFFPDGKWSRKGFMRSRWRIDHTPIDLVNIHLFHDACNLLAVEQSPSIYSSHRKVALTHALKELNQTSFTSTMMFLFGDFNFRLDNRSLVKSLTPMGDKLSTTDHDGHTILEYRRPRSSDCILSIGTKTFEHESQNDWQHNNLLEFDKETSSFPTLYEQAITFQPSYPFSENADEPKSYMKTRAPAWCDRVLMNEPAWQALQNCTDFSIQYNLIGQTTCMGDHKPVFLTFPLLPSFVPRITDLNGDGQAHLQGEPGNGAN